MRWENLGINMRFGQSWAVQYLELVQVVGRVERNETALQPLPSLMSPALSRLTTPLRSVANRD